MVKQNPRARLSHGNFYRDDQYYQKKNSSKQFKKDSPKTETITINLIRNQKFKPSIHLTYIPIEFNNKTKTMRMLQYNFGKKDISEQSLDNICKKMRNTQIPRKHLFYYIIELPFDTWHGNNDKIALLSKFYSNENKQFLTFKALKHF